MDCFWRRATNYFYIFSYVLFAFEINIRASAVLDWLAQVVLACSMTQHSAYSSTLVQL